MTSPTPNVKKLSPDVNKLRIVNAVGLIERFLCLLAYLIFISSLSNMYFQDVFIFKGLGKICVHLTYLQILKSLLFQEFAICWFAMLFMIFLGYMQLFSCLLVFVNEIVNISSPYTLLSAFGFCSPLMTFLVSSSTISSMMAFLQKPGTTISAWIWLNWSCSFVNL